MSLHTSSIAFSVLVCQFYALIISLGFYILSISQFCTNISKLLTQLARRTRDLLEFVFIISQTKRERRAHEKWTVCVACSRATESKQSLCKRPTRTQLRSQRQPVGRSRLHDDCGATLSTLAQARESDNLDSVRVQFRARWKQQQRSDSSNNDGDWAAAALALGEEFHMFTHVCVCVCKVALSYLDDMLKMANVARQCETIENSCQHIVGEIKEFLSALKQ